MLHAWRSQKEKTLQVLLTGSVGLGWDQSPLPPHTHAQHWLLFLLYFCCYNFIKLLSGNNCSFNYSLLVINYLKINIMILFPFLLFFLFRYLSHLRCSLILGFFRDTPTAPAAQRPLSQCHLSPALPSISPSRLSGLRVHDARAGERNIPKSSISHPWALTWCSFSSPHTLSPCTQDTDSRDQDGSIRLRFEGCKCRFEQGLSFAGGSSLPRVLGKACVVLMESCTSHAPQTLKNMESWALSSTRLA